MIRTVIVEDEPLSLSRLRRALALHEDIDLLGHAQDGPSAVAMLDRYKPSLLFLDVQIPIYSGLEVLRQAKVVPAIVFTTAYDTYAVPAFEWGAFDYLLKPFDDQRVARAIARYRQRSSSAEAEPLFAERLQTTESGGLLRRFFVRHRGAAIPVEIDQIIAIVAEGDYCRLHLSDINHLIHVPLREFEKRLDAQQFRRVHRSAIVQLSHIKLVETSGRGAVLTLSAGLSINASRSGLSLLRDLRFSSGRLGFGEPENRIR